MALQASAIVDVRPGCARAALGLPARLRVEPMAVRTATDPTVLTRVLDSKAAAPAH
jgi:hypothetical protein